MEPKQPAALRIRHEATPQRCIAVLSHMAETAVVASKDIPKELIATGDAHRVLARLRLLGLVSQQNKSGPYQVTSRGKALLAIKGADPSVGFEILHLLFYFAGSDPQPTQAWTYMNLIDTCWKTRCLRLTHAERLRLLNDLTHSVAEAWFGGDVSQVSLDNNCLLGATMWLRKLQKPPVVTVDGKDLVLKRREWCHPSAVVLAVSLAAMEAGVAGDGAFVLTEPIASKATKALYLEPEALLANVQGATRHVDFLVPDERRGPFLRYRFQGFQKLDTTDLLMKIAASL
jgi:hypothetical protein